MSDVKGKTPWLQAIGQAYQRLIRLTVAPESTRSSIDAARTPPHRILFLAANPGDTDRFALDREARSIQKELEQSGQRDSFELVTRWPAEPLDLVRELRRLRPMVVHYSGRCGQDGVFLLGADGGARSVSSAMLAEVFGAAGTSVKLVVLNACYSEEPAEALVAHVDCVVGTHRAIGSDAARNFAIGFYGGLGERESVAAAYQQGCAAIGLDGMLDADRPRLKVRAHIDATRLVPAASPP